MYEPSITITGNLGADPRARVTADQVPVTDFRVAVTPRKKDRGTEQWGDLTTIWFTVTAWRQLALNCGESLKTGDRVVVTGSMTVSTWKDADGNERNSLEITAESVGLDLSKGRAAYVKATPLTVATDPGERPTVDGRPVDVDTGEIAAPVAA